MTTADVIVDVAQEFIQKGGFHAFSYRDIAARVGVKTASIHYHFPTKADLVRAIADRVLGGVEGGLKDLAATTLTAPEKLRRFCGTFLDTYGDGDRLCPMCMLAMGQDTVPESVRDAVRAFWSRAESWVAMVVSEGQRAGEVNALLVPQAVGRTFVAALEGGMVAARAFSDRSRLTDVIDYLLLSISLESNPAAERRLTGQDS
jgi:TetR/AcrR family transcriptional repressor of nem operon